MGRRDVHLVFRRPEIGFRLPALQDAQYPLDSDRNSDAGDLFRFWIEQGDQVVVAAATGDRTDAFLGILTCKEEI